MKELGDLWFSFQFLCVLKHPSKLISSVVFITVLQFDTCLYMLAPKVMTFAPLSFPCLLGWCTGDREWQVPHYT